MGKRLFDVCFSLGALLLGFPVFLLCALIVKTSSPGPIFYAHRRVGRNGIPFGCWKFRTMYRDAEKRLQPLLASDPSLMHEWQVYFKLKQDPRVTPIGKFLRKTSLDELPQFFNVLKGEMSVVGPRPLTDHEVSVYLGNKASKILSVRPGITTLWVTQGRNRFSLEERVLLEEQYVTCQSFWLDCKLIFRTLLQVLFPKGAY